MARGTEIVTLEELRAIETPPATPTYTPLSHYDLTRSLKTISQDILTGCTLESECFEVAQGGNQLFGKLIFNTGNQEMGLTVGYRNSLNKSMSVGMCVGSNVIVCSNLMFSPGAGGIVVMKKHSRNLMDVLESTTVNALYKAKYTFNQLIEDSERLKARGIDDNEAFKMLGLLFGYGLLSPRQLPVARDQWLKPNHEEFQGRNMFGLYNACTEALKSSPPAKVMENHIELHQAITGEWS